MKVVHRSRGISLVEVMVTLLLLVTAAGALAHACAHVRSTASRAATQQTAWRLASEMAEWLSLRGDRPLGRLPDDPSSLIGKAEGANDCFGSACTPAEAARFFLRDWYRRLRARLPGVSLRICYAGLEGVSAGAAGADADLTEKKNTNFCSNSAQTDEIVWFRLWEPRKVAGTNHFTMIDLFVRRAP